MRFTTALATSALVAGAMLAVAPAAQAAPGSYTWTGLGDNSSWTDANNWTPHGYPHNGDDATLGGPDDAHCEVSVGKVPDHLSLHNFNLFERGLGGDASKPCRTYLQDGSITVTSTMTWNNGETFTPITIAKGGFASVEPDVQDITGINADIAVYGELDLENNTDTGGVNKSVAFTDSEHITVEKGGKLISNGDNAIEDSQCCTSGSKIYNYGTLEERVGTLTLQARFAQRGQLRTYNGSSHVVSVSPATAATGATYVGGGSYQVTDPNAQVVLTGTQTLANGFHYVLGGHPADSTAYGDGTEQMNGTFTFAGSGEFDWMGGHLAADVTLGHGVTTVVPAESYAKPDGVDFRHLDATDSSDNGPARVTNDGSMSFVGAPFIQAVNHSRIYNKSDGVVNLASGTAIYGAGAIGNQGRLNVESGLGDKTDEVFLDGFGVANSGTLVDGGPTDSIFEVGSVANSGLLLVSDGTLRNEGSFTQTAGKTTVAAGATVYEERTDTPLVFSAGSLTGNGTIQDSVTNTAAIVSPSGVGRLTILGDYTAGSKATLYIDVGGSDAYDALLVEGTATLNGTLIGHALATPATSWKPVPVQSGKRVGSFSCVVSSGPGSTTRHWQPAYGSTKVALSWVSGRHTSC